MKSIYRVSVRGPVPAYLAEKLAQAHAAAVLATKKAEARPQVGPRS